MHQSRSPSRHTPAEDGACAWIATAKPVHADWGREKSAAQAEVADMVEAIAGGTPDTALVRARKAKTGRHGETARMDDELARSDVLVTPKSIERAALGLPETDAQQDPAPSQWVQDKPRGVALTPARTGLRAFGPPEPPWPSRSGVETLRARYGDIWLRDTGPVFVRAGEAWRGVAFRFNGWGRKYIYDGDDSVAECLARLSDCGLDRLDMVGEPGALEFDGENTLITSRRCLLNSNRNPNLAASDAEAIFAKGFGVEHTIWIEEQLIGDHTDGHTDTLVRYVRPGLVVTESPAGRNDPNGPTRDAVARRLDGVRDAQGRVVDVARIPGARAIEDPVHGLLPATHLNFVLSGDRVIVPLYGGPADASSGLSVLAAFGEIFPDREIIGLSCQAILTGGGGFHCSTSHAPREAGGPWLS